MSGDPPADASLANRMFRDRGAGPVPLDAPAPFGERLRSGRYLSPHSDLVAATVLVHQAAAHNAVVRASFDVRRALHRDTELNRELKEPAGKRWPSTDRVLDGAAADLVDCFLFVGEPPLTGPITAAGGFAAEFPAAGPRDGRGRSLRDLDLRTRTFRHPCCHLVHDASFAALPAELRRRFWDRMAAVLAGREPAAKYQRLSAADPEAIREILRATRPEGETIWLK
jgi:hypothetical protein